MIRIANSRVKDRRRQDDKKIACLIFQTSKLPYLDLYGFNWRLSIVARQTMQVINLL